MPPGLFIHFTIQIPEPLQLRLYIACNAASSSNHFSTSYPDLQMEPQSSKVFTFMSRSSAEPAPANGALRALSEYDVGIAKPASMYHNPPLPLISPSLFTFDPMPSSPPEPSVLRDICEEPATMKLCNTPVSYTDSTPSPLSCHELSTPRSPASFRSLCFALPRGRRPWPASPPHAQNDDNRIRGREFAIPAPNRPLLRRTISGTDCFLPCSAQQLPLSATATDALSSPLSIVPNTELEECEEKMRSMTVSEHEDQTAPCKPLPFDCHVGFPNVHRVPVAFRDI